MINIDFLKIGISSLTGAIAGLIAGGFTTIAYAPIAVTIFAGGITGTGLNWADEHYSLTSKLITVLEEIGDEIDMMVDQTENTLYRGTKSFFRAQGLRIPNY